MILYTVQPDYAQYDFSQPDFQKMASKYHTAQKLPCQTGCALLSCDDIARHDIARYGYVHPNHMKPMPCFLVRAP